MKINGTNANFIRFHHDGMNSDFEYIQPNMYTGPNFSERSKIVVISFSDLLEVDEMIMMLERFKNECTLDMGKAHPCND